MALKDTIHTMKKLLEEIAKDLHKATLGNKAASQRVRTGSIKFDKIAKVYRKESVAAEKKAVGKSKKSKDKAPAKKATAKLSKKK